MSDSEEALVQAARHDPAAFGEIYQRYLRRIYRYLYYRTGSQEDAEDLTERVFLQALTHLPTYTDRGLPFSAWLFRIAHNLVANWHRDRQRQPVVPLETGVASLETGPDLDRQEDHVMVRQAVLALPPDRQLLILLKFVEEMTNAEIGRIMGRTEGAVKALLHRTLRTLRDQLVALEVSAEGQKSG